MTEPEQTDRQSVIRLWLAFVFCVLMYFLSVGPAVWLAEHGYISPTNPILQRSTHRATGW